MLKEQKKVSQQTAPDRKHSRTLVQIAHIQSDFPTKFGIPRQSGLVEELRATIVFEPEFRSPEALRGLEGFSYLWLLWDFSETKKEGFTATVRPPRLGGNTRMGVFATRSPFRPNPIGLSCVRIASIRHDEALGPVIEVIGADLMNNTPIYDIKPYLPYTDAHPEAKGGFASEQEGHRLRVEIPKELAELLREDKRSGLCGILAEDPRPSYQEDPKRSYGFVYAGYEVKFRVAGETLTVHSITKAE